ncbi:VOC family protein [Jatrophihabitans fulvus]
MDLDLHITFLPHDDPEASLAFYRDMLDLEVRNDVGQGAMRWITVGSPRQPGISVVLSPPGANPGITDDERRTISDMMAKGTFATVVFETSDLDGAFARIEAAGTEIVQEPTDQPWGVRDFAVRDPAGTMVRVNQSRRATTDSNGAD